MSVTSSRSAEIREVYEEFLACIQSKECEAFTARRCASAILQAMQKYCEKKSEDYYNDKLSIKGMEALLQSLREFRKPLDDLEKYCPSWASKNKKTQQLNDIKDLKNQRAHIQASLETYLQYEKSKKNQIPNPDDETAYRFARIKFGYALDDFVTFLGDLNDTIDMTDN